MAKQAGVMVMEQSWPTMFFMETFETTLGDFTSCLIFCALSF